MAGPVKDREAFQRLSFLYQVSPSRGRSGRAPPTPRDRLSRRPPTASSRGTPRTRRWRGSTATRRGPWPGGWSCGGEARGEPGAGRGGGRAREPPSLLPLPSARRDPSVKRTLCRGCSSLLIPGLTCTQRQRRECACGGGGGRRARRRRGERPCLALDGVLAGPRGRLRPLGVRQPRPACALATRAAEPCPPEVRRVPRRVHCLRRRAG